jgi:hypothetical protein
MKSSRTHLETWKQKKSQVKDPNQPQLQVLERLIKEFPHIPAEAIIKEDMLRSGLSFSRGALEIAARYKTKAYFIFSFDHTPISEMQKGENLKSPEEIRIIGGPHQLLSTVISVRNNLNSPYEIREMDDVLGLFLEDSFMAKVELPPMPPYYNQLLVNGKPFHEVAPTIEWGYLLYLTIFRQCQYWGKEEECLFCDINENYRQQKDAGRPYQSTKTCDEILEALEILNQAECNPSFNDNSTVRTKAYTITGGSITSHLKGQSESEFYLQYARAIEEKFPQRWIGKVVLQALPLNELWPLKKAGIRIYHPNYEIWDERLFKLLCPGKERYVGREEWHKRILDSAQVFGPENVIPNFVAGIEMAQPHGFTDISQAVDSTRTGLDFFMKNGISPRYTVWCPEPLTALGSNNFGAPLEYHVRLMEAWRETHDKYRLPVPPGYGEPGRGKAVFSVSAFMDILRNH